MRLSVLLAQYCEKRVLMRIFGPKGDEVTREWRNPHNEEIICNPNPILFG